MKRWKISLAREARRQLVEIEDKRIRKGISRRIDKLEYEPEKQGKPLTDELAGYRSVRAVGQRYRIIYKIEEERVVVLILTLIIPILFFIGVGIQFALAKAFGGNGRFVGQCYAQLLYQVPLTILTSVISTLFVLFVQFTTRLVISPVVSLALFIYGVLLNVMVIAGVHNMTRGKATAVVLIPYIVGALLACGLALYFAKLIISALHNVQ
jgi:mRNA-degrading endonuclease RelE of RelBE toxin-antitoxin system